MPNPAGGFDRTVGYTSARAIPPGGDQHEFGALNVDLSRLEVTRIRHLSRPTSTPAGSRSSRPRRNVNVVFDYSVDAGVVMENGEPVRSGTDMTGS